MPTNKDDDNFDWSYQGDGDITMGGLFVNGEWQYVEIKDLSDSCSNDPGMVQIDLGSIWFGIQNKYRGDKIVAHEFRNAINEYQSVLESCENYPMSRQRRIQWWNEWRSQPRVARQERAIRSIHWAKGGESDHDEYVVYDIESWSENYDSTLDSNRYHHGRPTAFVNGEDGLNYWIRFHCWGAYRESHPGSPGLQEVEVRDESFNGEYKRHVVLNFETAKPWTDYDTACGLWAGGNMSNLGRISKEDAELPHVIQCERCLEHLK